MVSGTRAVHNIEVTAESLQEDLDRLEVQRQALERELAAVVAHLGSVQRALSALQVLMREPSDGPADPAPAARRRQTPAPPQVTAKAPARVRRASTAADAAADAEGQKKYGRLTEQILDYFATVGDADVRARDVAAALGRDTDSGTINAVRSTLDRLVGTSRIRRSGRGLYRARRS